MQDELMRIREQSLTAIDEALAGDMNERAALSLVRRNMEYGGTLWRQYLERLRNELDRSL